MIQQQLAYVLRLADNALILGQRNSEWCGHGLALEEDIALTNISLDLIGQARLLYAHAAALESAASGRTLDENDYAYLTKLANSLFNNEIKLSDLVYNKHSDEPRLLQVAQIMVAAATLAYIKMKDVQLGSNLKKAGDENLKDEFQWADQRAVLCVALRLDQLKDSEHPFLAEAAREL